MIELENVTCTLKSGRLSTTILDSVTCRLPTDERFVILGPHGSGKTSLIKLLAGVIQPTSGTIFRSATVSFPVGFAGVMQQNLSVKQNINFLSDIYAADRAHIKKCLEEATMFGEWFDQPFSQLPHQIRSSVLFAISYIIPFDVYLVDNVMAVGDDRQRNICLAMLEYRARHGGYIIATRDWRVALRFGQNAAVLKDGQLYFHANVKDAIDMVKKEIDTSQERTNDVSSEAFSG